MVRRFWYILNPHGVYVYAHGLEDRDIFFEPGFIYLYAWLEGVGIFLKPHGIYIDAHCLEGCGIFLEPRYIYFDAYGLNGLGIF